MKTFEELLADAASIIENGDKNKVASLLKDNFAYREKMRSQKELYENQISELRDKALKDGFVAVKKEELDALTTFKEKVGDFDQIQTRLQAIERLEQENKSLKNKATLNKAAQKLDYNPEALSPLIKDAEIFFEEDVPQIKINGTQKPLEMYVTEDLAVFLPAIKSGSQHRYPPQGVGESNGGNSIEAIVNNFISAHKPQTNKETN